MTTKFDRNFRNFLWGVSGSCRKFWADIVFQHPPAAFLTR